MGLIIVFLVPQVQFHDFQMDKGIAVMKARFLEKDNMSESDFKGVMWHLKLEGFDIHSAGITSTGRTHIYQLLYRLNRAGIPAGQIPALNNSNNLKAMLKNTLAWEKYFRI